MSRATHTLTLFYVALTATVLAAPAAQAACKTQPNSFSVGQRQSHIVRIRTDMEGCPHHFALDQGEIVSKATVVQRPKHGTLKRMPKLGYGYVPPRSVRLSDIAFRYFPERHYRGVDRYRIRVCGRSEEASGCTNLTYVAHVR